MALTNVPRRLTAAERAREPRLLHVVAWFDGWAQAAGGGRPASFPRRLTRDEADSWREGWAERKTEEACHAAHGFTPCIERAHDLDDRDAYLAEYLAAELAAHRTQGALTT